MQNWASNLDEQVRVMCADAGLCVKFTSVPARARAVRARLRCHYLRRKLRVTSSLLLIHLPRWHYYTQIAFESAHRFYIDYITVICFQFNCNFIIIWWEYDKNYNSIVLSRMETLELIVVAWTPDSVDELSLWQLTVWKHFSGPSSSSNCTDTVVTFRPVNTRTHLQ